MENEIKPQRSWLKITITVVVIFFIIVGLAISASFILTYKYQNKIYPGVMLDGFDLGGLTKTQAENIISGKFKETYKDGFNFTYNNNLKKIKNTDHEILNLNLDSQIQKIWEQGHNDPLWKKNAKVLIYPVIKKQISLDYKFDKELLKTRLQEEFLILENPAKNSKIEINIINEKTQKYQLDFTSSEIGETFNFNEAINELEIAFHNFRNPNIELLKSIDSPQITFEQAKTQEQRIVELLEIKEINLAFNNKTWPIKWSDFTHWLTLDLNDQEQITVNLNTEMVNSHLQAIAQEIDQKARDAKLQIDNGKVKEFQSSQNGQQLNIEESLNNIKQSLLDNKISITKQIELVVETTQPEIKVSDTNNLGIKEILGAGWSNFSGSPANRRHNIKTGAYSLHGILLAPDEEFSLIQTLGDIDAKSGYLPELVIKDNKTIPEYGGGLCQVGTTIFRSALQAGLKITLRRNHSYRVSYYEPAGTDATIYDPWPDFRFVNDTQNHVLIQTKLEKNFLTFEIWGTDDGRKIMFEGANKTSDLKQLKTNVFNITSPGPAKMIDTTALEPGKKKKTESAHNGADANFFRIITMPGKEPIKETWSSHYVPWQEVWLVGISEEDLIKKKEQKNKENESTLPIEEPNPENENIVE